jgi:hypothetical protein
MNLVYTNQIGNPIELELKVNAHRNELSPRHPGTKRSGCNCRSAISC